METAVTSQDKAKLERWIEDQLLQTQRKKERNALQFILGEISFQLQR